MKAQPPTHIVADGASLRTLCGRHIFRDKRALPYVAAAYVDRNVRAHGGAVCDLCDAVLDADARRDGYPGGGAT